MSEVKPAAPSPSPLSKQRLRLWLRLLRATRTTEAELRERLRKGHDSTLPRFDVLATLNRYPGGLRMSELSTHLKVSNGNVTGIVERLVAEGLAERASVEGDRRAHRVRLTETGRARFARMAAEHEAWIDSIFADLDEAELDTMIGLLGRIGQEGQQ
ncbi:MarR family transcriptional regulator [Rhodovulum sp. 12E13]|uniref:MarR family winged helix-turn-helix transcriptional regulator n=1 Tax=Rhodovulum sp. 12E13 TaxID=2203891 RepID=UPI000E11FA84|nr:MarR family transcriptional regulator [Rhodovulum sp. 12E13]RDC71810.1 MarR family transcriptional regulator [Rhodovulum sp. 12E13]